MVFMLIEFALRNRGLQVRILSDVLFITSQVLFYQRLATFFYCLQLMFFEKHAMFECRAGCRTTPPKMSRIARICTEEIGLLNARIFAEWISLGLMFVHNGLRQLGRIRTLAASMSRSADNPHRSSKQNRVSASVMIDVSEQVQNDFRS